MRVGKTVVWMVSKMVWKLAVLLVEKLVGLKVSKPVVLMVEQKVDWLAGEMVS